jgi:hypothetical protein
MKSSMYVDYCLPRNRWGKLGPRDQKSSNKPSSTADADIFSAQTLLLAQKQSTKTESLLFPKSSSKTSSTADDEIFNVRRLLLAQKPLRKTRTQGPKNHPRSPVLRLTLSSSAQKDYNWHRNSRQKLSPCCSQNHPRKPVLRLTMKSSMYEDYCLPETVEENKDQGTKNHPTSPVLRHTMTSSAHKHY